ncbi:hypothetical protein GCM10010156_32120 [Planobispora rosea]|uniref:Uncharacterized protein n=1 Tax=Planobispora rosea TaxID=35762 RepID=A0A8J3S202_PLARO|nr:hypothetical protein GCM10010156_32120 [Planobispora rosea]GIH85395.1 hypothetical protein Pro02_38030 [Planobispora rosea]
MGLADGVDRVVEVVEHVHRQGRVEREPALIAVLEAAGFAERPCAFSPPGECSSTGDANRMSEIFMIWPGCVRLLGCDLL